MLQQHIDALHEELLAEAKVKLAIDTTKLDDLVDELVDDSIDRAIRKGEEYADAESDRRYYKKELQKNMKARARELVAAVGRLPVWHGAKLLVKGWPFYNMGRWTIFDDNFNLTRSAEVVVYTKSPRGAPSFTYFYDGTVGDVLDAGDTDFFSDRELEADYFALVEELRHPGRLKKDGEKVVMLWTARPASDREIYSKAKTVPNNIFLTSSRPEAEGYNIEFGGDRDIWQVWIKKKYLLVTLDTPMVKNYQAYAPQGNKVPVEKMKLW